MHDFDWVQERSKCSLKAAFHALSEEVKSNVETANSLGLRDVKFSHLYQHNKILVSVERDDNEVTSLVFELTPSSIVVQQFPDKPLFSATPYITSDRRCGLEVNGQAMEIWQVSMKALDPLFFGRR